MDKLETRREGGNSRIYTPPNIRFPLIIITPLKEKGDRREKNEKTKKAEMA